ncbi:MAG TPA: SRPBCC family protein [Acidimicrobiia bacterium]|nr:SRPBCC family protein [Acidimicrobiia bacterium]
MEITDSFRVSTPIEDTWKVLLDIEGIAPCLPGAQLLEIEGNEYRGVVKVKVGPITAQYKGTATLAEVDEGGRRLVIDAAGRDTRGQGNAKATIVVSMTPEGAGTQVDVVTDLSITGKVAQFGRGVLADVSSKLMAQFVENLERDVLTTAGGGDTSHAGGPYEHALEAVAQHAPGAQHAPVTEGPRKIDSPEAQPVDLFDVAGESVGKRLVPVGIAALVLFVLWRLLRNRD